jgi:hypothetical protein
MRGWWSRLILATAMFAGLTAAQGLPTSAQEKSGTSDPSRTFSGTVEEIQAGSPGPVKVRIKPEVGPLLVLEALPQQMLDISQGDLVTVQLDRSGRIQKVMKKIPIPEIPSSGRPEPVSPDQQPAQGTQKDHP